MNDKVNLKKHTTKFIQTYIQNLQLYTNIIGCYPLITIFITGPLLLLFILF